MKTLEEMNVLDNFMFNAIAMDPEISVLFFREMLSVMLEREIGDIVVKAQSVMQGDMPELRGIQLDVEIWENDNCLAKCRLYNVEAQQYTEDFLEKRSRFYQAKKDSKNLKRGETNWGKLPDLYMIMITTFDPFGKDSIIYTFENTCKEYPDIEYNDGLKFIYFNTSGTKGGTEAIKQLLSYLKDSKMENVTNESTAQIHNYVTTVKQSAKVRNRFMTLGEWLDRESAALAAEVAAKAAAEAAVKAAAEGRAEGRAEGERIGRINMLLDILVDLGPVSETLEARLKTLDEDALRKWTKLAAKADNMEEFLEQIK